MPKRKKVLCIEDDPGTRELLVEVLEEAGFTVHAAEDGMSGIAAIAELRPDVILCDIDLPELSGFEVLERLRALGTGYRHVP